MIKLCYRYEGLDGLKAFAADLQDTNRVHVKFNALVTILYDTPFVWVSAIGESESVVRSYWLWATRPEGDDAKAVVMAAIREHFPGCDILTNSSVQFEQATS